MGSSFAASSNNIMLNDVSWIVDTGASDHMTPHAHLFSSMRRPEKSILIGFPDGHTKEVKYVGTIMINNELELRDVLYVPDFKHSLLSMSKLLNDYRLAAYFSAHGF